MALVWRPAPADQILELARHSWAAEAIDATWSAVGLPGGPVARPIFEDMWYWFGELSEARVAMRFDPDAIRGFSLDYAVFGEDPPDDPAVADLLKDAPGGWSTEPTAPRRRFDAVFAEATAALAGRLGPPASTGRHDHEWSHAVWRCDGRLIVNVQGEDVRTYSHFDAASLWTVEYDAAELPAGEAVYALLMA